MGYNFFQKAAESRGIIVFLFVELVALFVFVLFPDYLTIIYSTSALFGLYLVYKLPSDLIFGRKFFLGILLLLPLFIFPILTASPEYERVQSLRTLFEVLNQGGNPYIGEKIFHEVGGEAVFGNFNNLPLTIPFYWITHFLTGQWGIEYLILTNLLVRLLVCFVFMKTTPKLSQIQRLPFYLVFLFWGGEYPITTTFLIVALLMYFFTRGISSLRRISTIGFLPLLFGLGLLTKFFVIPIFFAFYYYLFFHLGKKRETGIHLLLIGSIALLMLVPFGLDNVIDSTILFNLNLGQRAIYATFYPNVFSGLLKWIGLESVYGVLAAGGFLFSVYFFDGGYFKKMIYVCFSFMIFMPTPEPQFLPILFYIVVVSKYSESYERNSHPFL